jgi:hypothetical protein
MKYWLDTEFIERGSRYPLELISIGIVAEDGREYYSISTEFNPKHASPWVKENVIALLPPRLSLFQDSPRLQSESLAWKSREMIAIEVMAFLKNLPIVDLHHYERSAFAKWSGNLFGVGGLSKHPSPKIQDIFNDLHGKKPEIWAYYADYDWVVLCQLFGTMMDLPKEFPLYCRDIKQWADQLGNPELPKQGEDEHNALADARWNCQAWEFLADQSSQREVNIIGG